MKRKGQAEFVQWMGPLLDALRELGDSGTPQETSDLIAKRCGISDEKREELMVSGTPRFHNQVCWARQYLVWEGLLSSAKRGVWTLTEQGKKSHLSIEAAHQLFRKWISIHAKNRKEGQQKFISTETADNQDLDADEMEETTALLEVLQRMTPSGFERFTKFLLRVYGFERVEVTPAGRDGGIDGYGVLQINPFV